MPKKVFRFDFYSLHAHLDKGLVNYVELVRFLADLRGFHLTSGNHHVAVGSVVLNDDGQLFLAIYSGFSEKSTLFFDLTERKEVTEETRPNQFQARKTYVLIDPSKRSVIIESKKGTLGPLQLAALIETYLRTIREYKTLELSLNTIADTEFTERLDSFTRIQAATITIARPNVDWTDERNKLTEIAAESDARSVDLTARSKRNKGLAKENGLIKFIRDSATSAKSMFQKIKITGAIGDGKGLITLDLNKHIKHTSVTMDADEKTGLPADPDVRLQMVKAMHEFKPDGAG
jgi:hypothetical protein